MKKYQFFMLALLGIVFTFASCSSDDDNSESLKGTTWICTDDVEGVRTLIFGEKDYFYTIVNNEETKNGKGTYTYTPPVVQITTINQTAKEETQIGRIEGNKLSFGDIVYTKQ